MRYFIILNVLLFFVLTGQAQDNLISDDYYEPYHQLKPKFGISFKGGADLIFLNQMYFKDSSNYKFQQTGFSGLNLNFEVKMLLPISFITKGESWSLYYKQEGRTLNFESVVNSDYNQLGILTDFEYQVINRSFGINYAFHRPVGFEIDLGAGLSELYIDKGTLLKLTPGFLASFHFRIYPINRARIKLGFGGGINFRLNGNTSVTAKHDWFDFPLGIYFEWISKKVFYKKKLSKGRRLFSNFGFFINVLANYKMLKIYEGMNIEFWEFPIVRLGVTVNFGLEKYSIK